MQKYGEFGHIECCETITDVKDSLVQLNFQLVRTNKTHLHILQKRMREILGILKQTHDIQHLQILYKMTIHVRDIVQGKGECALFYMMILVWYDFYPDCAMLLLYGSVISLRLNDKSFGSWKDIKYFCNYCLEVTGNDSHQMIEYAIFITNQELTRVLTTPYDISSPKSFVAKWIPREKSKKFGWLNKKLALDYYSDYIKTATDKWGKIKATNKALMEYRAICSSLNKELDTVEIKQCEQNMLYMNFLNTPSLTLLKQTRSLLNLHVNGQPERKTNPSNVAAAKLFEEFIISSEVVHGKNITLVQFAKQALRPNITYFEKEIINKQWKDNASQIESLRSMIPIVDCSQTMFECDALYGAMALACRIAEKSVIGRRILCFSSRSIWINLDDENCRSNFTDMIQMVYRKIKDNIGLTAHIHVALDTLLESIIDCEMPATDVEQMMFVIISSMKFEKDRKGWTNDLLYNMIKTKFENAGKSVDGSPYRPPHILFWNVTQGDGFPCSCKETNVSMMSGFSPVSLNSFRENDSQDLKICNPWSMLCSMLNKPRYNFAVKVVESYLEQ